MKQLFNIGINKASQNDILNCLLICDGYYQPKLSERVNLKEYADKLHLKAVNFECWVDEKLIGIVSMYCNEGIKSFGYISNVCVNNKFAGKGIGLMLLQKCIEYAEQRKISKIELEVNKRNIVAKKLYEKCGFDLLNEEGDSIIMQLRLR